jgi:RNA polymerase sigma factor (sigma-70 family)
VATDAEIIGRSLEDPRAFGEIFERHGDAVLSYARRRVGPAAAEDITAQAFLIALERRARYDLAFESARPWLLGIAMNLIRHHLRDHAQHLRMLARASAPVAEQVDDPDRADALRMRPWIVEALLELSAHDRETFLLVALADLTYEEAARAIGIPVGTVRSRIHRGRMKLRERLRLFEAIPEETDR